jgi:hypothetical protein
MSLKEEDRRIIVSLELEKAEKTFAAFLFGAYMLNSVIYTEILISLLEKKPQLISPPVPIGGRPCAYRRMAICLEANDGAPLGNVPSKLTYLPF